MKNRKYVPKGAVPGGAVKRIPKHPPLLERYVGRGPILECDSPELADTQVRKNFERVCRSYPLRQDGVDVALKIAMTERELHALQVQPKKSIKDRERITELMLTLCGCLTKLVTFYMAPTEAMFL